MDVSMGRSILCVQLQLPSGIQCLRNPLSCLSKVRRSTLPTDRFEESKLKRCSIFQIEAEILRSHESGNEVSVKVGMYRVATCPEHGL